VRCALSAFCKLLQEFVVVHCLPCSSNASCEGGLFSPLLISSISCASWLQHVPLLSINFFFDQNTDLSNSGHALHERDGRDSRFADAGGIAERVAFCRYN
jgi:hypothetical protein